MKFQVFKNGKPTNNFTIAGAYMFGPDGIALRRSKIRFKDGFVNCEKPGNESAGLALLWPIDTFGKVVLPTTCLPERERPYILNVELARAKLMQIINMREEWFFLNSIRDLDEVSRKSQQLFIQSLQRILDPPKAAVLADHCLEIAMQFSESLAARQSDSLFHARIKNHGFSRGCLGCSINPQKINDKEYLEKLLDCFGLITIPVKWVEIEPEKDKYDFSVIDACLKAVAGKRVAVAAGPLLYFSQPHLPKWLIKSGAGFEKIRERAYKFVAEIVSRYAGKIFAWRVVKGLNACNYFGFSFEEVLEITRAATMAAKASSQRALKIVEIQNPWGEYFTSRPNTIPPLVYIDMILQSGINFDAFGLPFYIGKAQQGMHVRDMMQISAALDYFRAVPKPLYITEVEVPSERPPSNEDNEAGVWHQPWDQTRQKQWIEQFYRTALSKPFVEAVNYSTLVDTPNSIIENSGLLNAQLQPKKSYKVLKKLQETLFAR